MVRKFFVGGNWKCNGTIDAVKSLIDGLNGADVPSTDAVEVIVAPTFVHLPEAVSTLRKDFAVSAQDCWQGGNGAFTGEISADMLIDLGVKWVILGHSERRHIIKESDDLIAEKTKYAISKGLPVIYCIGEQLEEREAGNTLNVCARQMDALKSKLSKEDWGNVVIAYEPVWAIGTGKVATPEQAQEVHASVRSWVEKNIGSDTAAMIRIIYGGSVNAGNCKELAKKEDIDGFLVGGASLKPEFVDIIKSAEVKGTS